MKKNVNKKPAGTAVRVRTLDAKPKRARNGGNGTGYERFCKKDRH
ncbi:hypothetical protein Q8A64_06720 [Oxalobacteraceae bacterium R-40]|uniref:Uncharacterized protein n=1 Tax=Keguizhuia sedimenti TaxID=3064264 RepID=A0ABU1BM89_9BURK|nr:hypothetical protein [Oxalobacteraceae bacterium R-40]